MRHLFLAFIALLAACFAGAWVLAQPTDPALILVHLVPVALAIVFSMYVAELVGVTERPLPPLRLDAVFAAIAASCFVLALGYAFLETYPPSVELLCAAPAVSTLAVYLQRKWVEGRGDGDAIPAALFAGTREEVTRALAAMAALPAIRVRSLVLPAAAEDRSPLLGLPIHAPEECVERMRGLGARMLLVGRSRGGDLRAVLAPCAGAGYLVESVGDLIARSQGRVDLEGGNDLPLLARLTSQARPFVAQRALDIALAGTAFLLTVFLWPLVALTIRLTSGGPVLFRQERVGMWGRNFTMLKFRTMRHDAEEATGPVWATPEDPRITPVGRFLRVTRLDELPQLWNVLRGDMSLVGPRPERLYFVAGLRARIPLYDARHCVRPGVTGWAQIRYPYGASEDDAREKLTYDLFYIFNRSLTFYFAVLLETVKVLLFRRGSR
ncbi:MAG: exopolysaccharide biosynthesis polyprenyl glycosylphosphotransferase [Planctomycetota bacterium]